MHKQAPHFSMQAELRTGRPHLRAVFRPNEARRADRDPARRQHRDPLDEFTWFGLPEGWTCGPPGTARTESPNRKNITNMATQMIMTKSKGRAEKE